MAKKKAEKTEGGADGGALGRVSIERKTPMEWKALLEGCAKDHWRTIRVTVRIREKLLAGKPAKLDAAQAMIKARGFEDVIEAKQLAITDPVDRAAAAEEVKDDGLCEFHRRDGKPGMWFPTNNIKAMIKENWSVLGLRMSERGSRGALAEGTFVFSTVAGDRDWLYLGEKPDGVLTAVCQTTGASGPQSSIKRNEYLIGPTLTFDIAIEAGNNAPKLPTEGIARMLYHASEHGLGASRSQGYGRFDILSIEEVEVPQEP